MEIQKFAQLVWGSRFSADVLTGWLGGLEFGSSGSAALVQIAGGPCAVLAPLQAFVVKNMLSSTKTVDLQRLQIPDSALDELLVCAMEEILHQACPEDHAITLVRESSTPTDMDPQTMEPLATFYNSVCIEAAPSSNLKQILTNLLPSFKGKYGILCFLYSVLMSHGLDAIREEMSDPSEPLIEPQHGHGSQALINLFLTGTAASYVWDGCKDLDGFLLTGISKQAEVGYLSLMERLRYIEVGTCLRSPRNPVWVISSETHLTVIFSTEKALVSGETPSEKARRIFQSYDPEGGSFIAADKLGEVLSQLGLESDPEYVNLMKLKLDSDGLGIILLPAFMEEYFPKQTSSVPDMFPVFHWNGMVKSNRDGVVNFKRGSAILLETHVSSSGSNDSDRLRMVLQTKWPSLDVAWDLGLPSID